jgi:hypothetical protein
VVLTILTREGLLADKSLRVTFMSKPLLVQLVKLTVAAVSLAQMAPNVVSHLVVPLWAG